MLEPVSFVVGLVVEKFFKDLVNVLGDAAVHKLKGSAAKKAFKGALERTIKWYEQESPQSALSVALTRKDGPLTNDVIIVELTQLVHFHRDPDAERVGATWKASIKSPPEHIDFAEEARRFINYLEEELWITKEFRPILDSKILIKIEERLALPEVKSRHRGPVGLYNVPDLPENFVVRAQALAAIKEMVLAPGSTPLGITGTASKVGLLGMGGIGKTVLATALARDEDTIRPKFPDGIIWMTFGQQADPTSKQRELFRALGETVPAFDTWQVGRAELGRVTEDLHCLIILDDVWEFHHAEAFTQLGKDCRILVTTRNANVLKKIGAGEHHVDVLPLDQAWKEFLPTVSGDKSPPLAARDVAKACGCLPLALSIVGALIRECCYTWKEARDELEAANIEELMAELPNYEHQSVFLAIDLSVKALPEREREAFLGCAVFPEDVLLPEAALQTLWSVCFPHSGQARRVAQVLVERSLLIRVNGRDRHYQFHDVNRHYLIAVARKDASLLDHHRQLVDAYEKQCPEGWASGPDDGYFFQFLPYHLAHAEESDILRQLLLDYRWLDAKGRATDVSSVIADYALLPDDETLRLVHRALCLSASALQHDWRQVPGQLLGRLLCMENQGDIAALLERARHSAPTPLLVPLSASLQSPLGSLRYNLTGHSDDVEAVALTPDGCYAVSASKDKTLKVWDLTMGIAVHTLKGHTDYVNAVAITPDGRYAVSGSNDNTLKVWDLTTGTAVHTIEGHTGGVTAVALTPDGRYAVSASKDHTLKVWDLTTGRSVATFTGENDMICCAVSRNNTIAAGAASGAVYLLELRL